MAKFVIGILVGAALAFGYVRWGVDALGILALPDKLRGNLVSSATEVDLYSLDRSLETRRRALEVLFANRPEFAASVDAEFGHPFLEALYKARAIREARILRQQWDAFDAVLAKPALRDTLEKKYGVHETLSLKHRMLLSRLGDYPFLKQWIESRHQAPDENTLLATLNDIAALPHAIRLSPPPESRTEQPLPYHR